MNGLDAISGAQRNHEPARSGGCQTAADIGGPLTQAATRFMEGLQSQNRARMGTVNPCSRQSELADPFHDSDLRRFTTAAMEVRAWKALVGIADNEGVAPFVAARAKARCNPLDPEAATRPAPSARPGADRLAAWWNEPEPALIQKLGNTNALLETVDVPALLQVPAVHTCRIPLFSLHYEKLGFITRYRRTRCAYDEPERAVSGDFRRVRVGFKQPHGSLSDRSGDKVVPPQLPSGRWFMFRSCRLPAAGIHRASNRGIDLRFPRKELNRSFPSENLKISIL